MNGAECWLMLDRAGFQTAWLLLSALWQSSILLGAAGVLACVLRRRRASVRHAILAAAILTSPLIPLLGWAASRSGTPQAPIPVMPTYSAPPLTAEPGEVAAPLALPPEAVTAAPVLTAAPEIDQAAARHPDMARAQEKPFSLRDYPWALALVAYAAGAAGLLCLVAVGKYRIGRRARRGRVITDPRVLGIFRAARERLGLGRDVTVVESGRILSPMTVGTLHPVILLPAGLADGSPDDDLLAIALHEVTHVQRCDSLLLTLLSFVRAALFFHPLVWLVCRQVSALAENACDDAVLDATGEPVSYAKMLARLAEQMPRHALGTELAAGIVWSKGAFLRRVEAILSDRRGRIRKLSGAALLATLVAAVLSVGLALALPLGQESEEQAADTPPAAEQATKKRPSVTQSARKGIPAARLPNDVKVQLVAVSRLDEDPRRWWRPDGTPLANPPYAGTKRADDKHVFELVFRVSEHIEGSENVAVGCHYTSVLGKPRDRHGQTLDSLRAVHIGYSDEPLESTNAQFAVATGPWSSITTWQPRDADGAHRPAQTVNEILFKTPTEEEGKVVLNLVHLPMQAARRICAIRKDGKRLFPFRTSSTGLVVTDTVCKFQAPLSQIDRFEFSARPYDKVGFRNISLRPGHKTDVRVMEEWRSRSVPAPAGVQRRQINRIVSEFAEGFDLSTPEAAYATINRVSARGKWAGWRRVSVKRLRKAFSGHKKDKRVDPAWAKVLRNARILDVWVWEGNLAVVAARLMSEFPTQVLKKPIDVRHLQLEDGEWRNAGNDRVDSLWQAKRLFERAVQRRMVDKAEEHAADIREAAESLFEKIRSADYEKLLSQYDQQTGRWKGDAWKQFPALGYYMVRSDWSSFAAWICRNFRENPIVSVEIGKMFRGRQKILDRTGWPTVSCRLTLKDGTLLKGNLPFEFNFDGGTPHWHGMQGIDWHHMYPKGLKGKRDSRAPRLTGTEHSAGHGEQLHQSGRNRASGIGVGLLLAGKP